MKRAIVLTTSLVLFVRSKEVFGLVKKVSFARRPLNDDNIFKKKEGIAFRFTTSMHQSAFRNQGALFCADATAPAASTSFSAIAAKSLGYIMGLGSLSVYTPIIIALISKKSAVGFSATTWIFNVIGLTLAVAYPYQKGFSLSTYIELIILTAQSIGILGIICFLNNQFSPFLMGISVYAILVSLLSRRKLPVRFLDSLQIASTLVCNYANIPQIILTFREGKAAWSRLTALLSVAGNAIRVYTTLTLAGGDKLFLFGYVLGVISNGVLLLQTFIFPSKQAE